MHGVECMRPEKEKNYRPTDKEPFMNERQREYFRNKLMVWKDDILKEARETLQHLQEVGQDGIFRGDGEHRETGIHDGDGAMLEVGA